MQEMKYRNIFSLLTMSLLIVLMLVVPCKVRNSLEASLGVDLTEVNTKGKISISASSCSVSISSAETVINNQQLHKLTPVVGSSIAQTGEIDSYTKVSFINIPKQFTSCTPFYILYQKFKAYLA